MRGMNPLGFSIGSNLKTYSCFPQRASLQTRDLTSCLSSLSKVSKTKVAPAVNMLFKSREENAMKEFEVNL
jgi:hypothetical protein